MPMILFISNRHGSSKRKPMLSKRGKANRGRAGQALAAHHGILKIGMAQHQIKKRMKKSALARAKRLRDEGRVFTPLVKIETGKMEWKRPLSEVVEVDDDDRCDEADFVEETEVSAHTPSTQAPSSQAPEKDDSVSLGFGVAEMQRGAPRNGKTKIISNKRSGEAVSKSLKRARKKKSDK
jgi:hypothetical protein